MKTIRTRVQVTSDRTVTVQVPEDVAPGEWEAVLVLDATDAPDSQRAAALRELRALPPLSRAGWPADQRVHRQDQYDDELPR